MSARPGKAASRRLFELSELILELQRSATRQPAEAFTDWIFSTVGKHVSFDSALWAKGHATLAGAPAMRTWHAYRQPQPLMAGYAKIAPPQPLLADALHSPGVPVVANVRDGRFDPFVEYLAKHGIAHAVNACNVDSMTGLLNYIALWRTNGEGPFTEDERLFVQAAFPHLVEAYTRNRMGQVLRREGRAGGRRWTAAAADCTGTLHYAEDGFARMLREEWSTWKSAQLPPPVSEAIASGKAERIVGAALVWRITPVQDLFLIEVRRCSPIDSLTPREREVAVYTSQGLSHKEIAALLGLAPATVRNHLAAASRRLQARNKAQLAVLVRTYD
jgi:DNA-binding CsgD family transcriptional regulator